MATAQPLAAELPLRRFGVCYDFRNPPEASLSMPELYSQALDQIAWLDGRGLDQVWFTEHHFVDDGYLPSWISCRQRGSRSNAQSAVLL